MRNDHDTETDDLIDTLAFSKAVTRDLDDGVPVLPADETPTLKIIRVTDQDMLNDFEADDASLLADEHDDFETTEVTRVPTGDE